MRVGLVVLLFLLLCPNVIAGNYWEKDGRVLYEGYGFGYADQPFNGNCVYLNCSFRLTGDNVLDEATHTGCVFLNCDFVSEDSVLHLAARGGQVVLVDCRFSGDIDSIAWSACGADMAGDVCYQSGVTLNDREYVIQEDSPVSVVMDGMPILDAYKFRYAEKDYYNVYNLLSGYDGWDPLNMRDTLLMAEAYYNSRLAGIPVLMRLTAEPQDESKPEVQLVRMEARMMSGGYARPEFVGWSVSDDRLEIDERRIMADGCMITVRPYDVRPDAMVDAVTDYGLEAVLPIAYQQQKTAAPRFEGERPRLIAQRGRFRVLYHLDTDGREDCSRIKWFSADDPEGRYGLRKIDSSTNDCPTDCPARREEYVPGPDDMGRYIVVRVDARGGDSGFGEAAMCVSATPVKRRMIRKAK